MTSRIQDKHVRPVIAAVAVAVAPHVFSLPPWVTVWCALSWGYMVYAVPRGWPWPTRMARHILTVIGLLGVLNANRTLGGEFYIGLLAIMAGLKPMEMETHRDRMVTVFLAYFIVITSLFQSESLGITIYMFISVTVSTAVLKHINHPGDSMRANLKYAARIMIQAAPLMVGLFLLFPRVQGSLWGMMGGRTGRTGFSEYLQLGDVERLAQDDRPAFRAEFKGGVIPPPEALYWRGAVFQRFNGRGWDILRAKTTRLRRPEGADRTEYVITMEPHNRRQVFSLDLAERVEGGGLVSIQRDHTLRFWRPIVRRERFHIRSILDFHTGPFTSWESVFLNLPPTGNSQTKELALQWRDAGMTPERIVEAALNFFSRNKFEYTLQPPLLEGHMIDMFLFQTRRGYCEHFASAFVYLMRAAGIPARVVGGYLGGEVNPYGNFLIVRQADAHAWAEVWLENKGWTRVDPTAVVAPGRITSGLAGAVPADEAPAFLNSRRFGVFSAYWQKMKYGWEAVNTQWDIWFSSYSYIEQRSLLARIGIRTMNWFAQIKVLAAGTGLILLLALIVFTLQFARADGPRDRLREVYDRFCDKMARVGLARQPAEGPLDYARRVAEARSDLAEAVFEITDAYVRMRYGRGGDAVALRELRVKVNRFQPIGK